MAEQWLSIVEYARTFNVSDMTVRRRIKTGRLHAIMKDGKYFIPVPTEKVRNRVDTPSVAREAAPAMRTVPQQEMVVIKSHPAGHKTYVPPVVPPRPSEPARREPEGWQDEFETPALRAETAHNDGASMLPRSLVRPMEDRETSLVDTRALLAFCEASLRKFSELERRQVEKFKAKLEALEAQLAERDQRITQLKQQVEDLQVLVKILENKK